MTRSPRATLAAVTLLVMAAMPGAAQEREGTPSAPVRSEGEGPYNRLIIRGVTVIDGTGAPAYGPCDLVIEKNPDRLEPQRWRPWTSDRSSTPAEAPGR